MKNIYKASGPGLPLKNIGDIIEDATEGDFGSMFRARPYDGQPWTDHGERGKTEIKGITFRDLRDCFIRAVAQSSGRGALYQESEKGERANITAADLYAIDLSELDIIAVGQNLSCEVEKLMGIFPNVKDNYDDDPTIAAIKS